MTTVEERREVARRLREIRPCKSGHIEWWKIAQALGLKELGGWFGWEKFEPDNANHLADLIDPGELKTACIINVKIEGEKLYEVADRAVAEYTGIDRDALLVEAKELEKCAHYFGLDFDEDEPLRDRLKEASEAFAESARRVREALGVEHAES